MLPHVLDTGGNFYGKGIITPATPKAKPMTVMLIVVIQKTRKGIFTALRKTMRRRRQAKLREIHSELRRCMHDPVPEQGAYLRSVVGGHPDERSLLFSLPEEGLSTVVEGSQAPKPQTQTDLGSDETPHGQMAPSCSCLSSLPFSASWRHLLRQEPYAVVPHVRICAEGAG